MSAANRWPFAVLAVACGLLLIDQFSGAHEERATHIGQSDWVERQSALGRGTRFSRNERPAHRYNAWRTQHWHTVHLSNGRWFQIKQRDNGVLQDGDSVRIHVAPITQRVLRFQRLGSGLNRMRATADALEDLLPFPVVLGALAIALLGLDPRKDAALYLRWLVVIIGIVFLLALFATTWPLMRVLGWA